jgi:cytochrome d ubiquinol oxidase subunit II
VPLDAEGYFFDRLWTDFDPRSSTPGVLDWYTILVGMLALSALVLHGANNLGYETEGPLNGAQSDARPARVAGDGGPHPCDDADDVRLEAELADELRAARPWGVVFPILAVAGLVAVLWGADPVAGPTRPAGVGRVSGGDADERRLSAVTGCAAGF